MATSIIKNHREKGRVVRFGTVGNNGWLCIPLEKANSYTVHEVAIYGGAVLNESSSDGYTIAYSYPYVGLIALLFHGNAFTDCYNNQYNIQVTVDVT